MTISASSCQEESREEEGHGFSTGQEAREHFEETNKQHSENGAAADEQREEEELFARMSKRPEGLNDAQGHVAETSQILWTISTDFDLNNGGLFETYSDEDQIIYVTQPARGKNLALAEGGLEDTRRLEEGQRVVYGQSRSFILINKQGECKLQVDIPPARGGIVELGGLCVFCAVLAMILAVALVGFPLWTAIHTSDVSVILLCCLFAGIGAGTCTISLFMAYVIIQACCMHVNLTITPTTFSIRRMLKFGRRHRDFLGTAEKAAQELGWLERIFCNQIEGDTCVLTRAEIKECTSARGQWYKYFVLLEGEQEHKLQFPLPDADEERLVAEINRTLSNIRSTNESP